MTASTLIMIAVAETLLNLACASHTGAVRDGSPQIALRRGGSVATFKVEPPAILGSTAQLRLEGEMLQGFVGNGTIHVKIGNERASGFGPSGSIDVRIQQQGIDVLVDGLWNGGPTHLVIGPSQLKGTVTRWGANVTRPEMCGYELDHRDQGGALVGISTCAGMPERTWLDVDERVTRLFKPADLAVVLVTILANPSQVR